jgi:tetratricopeptide (TPR) repeat protein
MAAEKAANLEAQAREAEARAVLEFVEERVLAAARPEGQEGGLGHAVTLRQALDAALPFVAEGFAAQPLIAARLRRTLGRSSFYLGEAGTAADQFEASRALYARHRGPDHPDTLTTMHDLASSYQALGRYDEALKLREETLALRRAKLGPNHPDTFSSMHGLATSYDALGRQDEALKLREETLALRRAKLGPDHPDTFSSMHDLAASYHFLGRYAEALKLHEETLALRTAKLGPDHPDTLTTRNNLASSYDALGRRAEALKLREETLALQKARLGPNHPSTLRSMHDLASSYDALGRRAEALKLREETLALRTAKLGPDHRDTLMTMHDLASSYQALGRWEEALAAYCRSIELDPDYHDAWNYAATLWAQSGDRTGYREHCRRMLDRFGGTTDPIIAERTAKACLVLPLGGPEQESACDLADRAVAMARGHWVRPWAESTQGLAAYRRERFTDAVAWADRCLARAPGDWNRELPAHLVRAMALARLGHRDEARAAQARASDLYRATVAKPGGRAQGAGWHDQVICEILRREAEADFLDGDFPTDPFAY